MRSVLIMSDEEQIAFITDFVSNSSRHFSSFFSLGRFTIWLW